MSLNQLSPIAQAELETGTTTRPPKLKGAEDFSTWKTRIQSFFEYTDYNLWLSVTAGPHVPTVVRGDAVVTNNDATTFTDKDKALIQRDRRAHAALTMALSTNDCNMFEEHRTANALWNALIEYYEGNEELIESKRDMVQKQYDMFCGVRGESLSDHISRFLNMMTKMKKAGNPVTNRAAIKKLLDSLPKEWSLQCMMIKKDFLNNPNPVTLSDLINTLRAFEMDVNKREMNTAGYQPKATQPSAGLKNVAFLASGGITPQASDLIYANASASASKAPQLVEKTIIVDTQALKVSTENVALFNTFLSSYEALMSGELKKEMFTAEDMYQVDPDDMEEMDLKWQMAMITLRLKKFQDKTGKRLGLGKAGFDKSKLRCYNCKNLGHFKRDCPLLKEGNSETTPAVKQITVEENKSNASPSTPKALVVEDYDWSEEITEAKEQVSKALMAKISSESSARQFEKQTTGIPTGNNDADKGLKDASKEKADKDLVNSIPLSFKEKLCSEACVDVVAHYKFLNLEFERQKDKALKINNELKQNEAAYQRKLNSTLAEMQTLKEFVFRKDFIINDLTERLEKALNEKNKLQIIIDKWNVSQKAFTDIKNFQRPTFVKDGIGYKDRHGNERKLFFPPHSKNYVPMPTPHPENDLINEKASVEQDEFYENETTANCSKSNADSIECKEDVCDDDGDCGGSKIGIGYSGDSYSTVNWFVWNCSKNNVKDECNSLNRLDDCNGLVPKIKSVDDCKGHVPTFETRDHEPYASECHDLNYACCDDNVACESPVFVPELKRNSFGKFLTEEIPEFIPSRTGITESEKSVTEDQDNVEDEQTSESSPSETSTEDQATSDESFECSSYEASEEQSSSEDNTSESSLDSDSDEEFPEDESRVDKKMKKAESSRLSSHTSSSHIKRPRHKRCFRYSHLGHTAKHCKTKKLPKPEHDFITNVTHQLNYLKKSVKNLVESTAYLWKQKENKLQKWLRMLMEYIWHVDSGCSRHMTGGKIVGVGDVVSEALTLENVNYVPELCYNLMSVSQVCDKGISVLFNDMECLFLKPGYVVPAEMIMLTAPRQNNTYVLNMKNAKTNDNLTCLISKASESESLLWHRRMGHVNFKNMNKLSKLNLVRGLPIKEFPFSEKCIACAQGKQHKKPHKSKAVNTISAPLQLLHMDLFVPISVKSLAKSSYCLVVTDDHSRFSWVYFLEAKSETAEVLKTFIPLIENVTKLKVKSIRSDNGSEFKNQTFISFCAEKGIHLQYSAARTPQQNGVAERKNRTLIEAARTMLVDSKLPIIFWAEAVNTACYVLDNYKITP
ncbi:putative RNA-directed DNA polymerase [Helianthus anomalus]